MLVSTQKATSDPPLWNFYRKTQKTSQVNFLGCTSKGLLTTLLI